MTTGEDILAFYEQAPYERHTINKLAKALEKSYGWAHKECKQLISEGVLTAEPVGPSIVCTVNFSSNKAIALLCLASAERTDAYLKEHQPFNETIKQVVNETKDHAICIMFTPDRNIIIVESGNHRTHVVAGMKVTSIDRNSFKPQEHKDSRIVFGFEAFWRITGEQS